MKQKLSHSQLQALTQLIEHMVHGFNANTLELKLLWALIHSIHRKLQRKKWEYHKKHVVTLSPEEALGFWVFFNKCPLPTHLVYETNLVQTICSSIHRKFFY